jgi:demethylmenaquinone methyltransferase/2-methoxy-6-polyprenyl-1,4-benzoquinol methylase
VNSAGGTTPPGTAGQQEAADWVRRMFAAIAPKYDFVNHLLSFNIDRTWRKVLMNRLTPVLTRQGARVLDLCCGTGDVLIDLQDISPNLVMGADFCHPMLVSARQKASRKGFQAAVFEADALQLPVAAETFDVISVAFGFRNLASYAGGLQELQRVLRPGGMLAILEFSQPPGFVMKTAYGLYSEFFLPVIGALISGSREAYAYLPASIRKFPPPFELQKMMEEAGFVETGFELLTGGIAALHLARKR